ncbi:hypothetical protein [Haloarcula montana]|uniref:hypothetical protein n=1 Tax=Haloarcula montana TaxID=3111776 RepID=UPI002D77FCB0|nr:hypothetical protein [Haloarcula sp. GH36]
MKGRRIGLLETHAHENFLADLAQIAHAAGYEVTLFTGETVASRLRQRLDTVAYEWIIKDDDESLGRFLGRVSDRCQALDLLYLFPLYGSVPDFFRYARFSPSCKIVLSIYNANSWVGQNLRFTPKLYNYARLPLRQILLRNVDAVTVEYDPIQQYLNDLLPIPVNTMTPVFSRRTTHSRPADGPLRVTVPGNVVASRRRYDLLFDALEALPTERRDRLSVDLLGRPMDESSDRILRQAARYRKRGWQLTTHEGWIDGDEFEQTISESDILLSPLCRRKAHGIATEVYGQTKSSGVLGDSIRTATPLAVPEWFTVPNQFGDGAVSFADSRELAALFDLLADRGDRLRIARRGAAETADYYALDAQAERFRSLVEEVCEDHLNQSVVDQR